MQRSSEQVTPKEGSPPSLAPPPGRAVLSIAATFPLCTAIEILCREYLLQMNYYLLPSKCPNTKY